MIPTTLVNKLTVVHLFSDGTAISGPPDVCKSPAIPIPYVNVAFSRDLILGSTTVKVDGSPIALKDSLFSTSYGDEPGVGGGIISGVNKGTAKFINYSMDVFVEGRNVCRLTDPMLMNGNTDNTANPAEVQGNRPPPLPPKKQKCNITSLTVATSPANRDRTRIGVGEEVDLTVDPGPANWAITKGGGKLDGNSGSTVRFTASDKAEQVTITATASPTTCTITFSVVEPSSWTMIRQSGTNLRHRRGRPDCGWKGITFFHPNDVNFYRVEDREKDSQAVATGSYATFNGAYHGHYPPPDRASGWFPLVRHTADGTTDDAPDEIYSGDTGAASTGANRPFTVGQMYFPITLQWRVVGSANIHDLPVVRQEHEIFANGKCESRKGGHTEQTMFDDATSTY